MDHLQLQRHRLLESRLEEGSCLDSCILVASASSYVLLELFLSQDKSEIRGFAAVKNESHRYSQTS
jgi:hypothetical protein